MEDPEKMSNFFPPDRWRICTRFTSTLVAHLPSATAIPDHPTGFIISVAAEYFFFNPGKCCWRTNDGWLRRFIAAKKSQQGRGPLVLYGSTTHRRGSPCASIKPDIRIVGRNFPTIQTDLGDVSEELPDPGGENNRSFFFSAEGPPIGQLHHRPSISKQWTRPRKSPIVRLRKLPFVRTMARNSAFCSSQRICTEFELPKMPKAVSSFRRIRPYTLGNLKHGAKGSERNYFERSSPDYTLEYSVEGSLEEQSR